MLRASRRKQLRTVVLGMVALILAAVLLVGLLREREASDGEESHEHTVLLTPPSSEMS